MDGKADAEVNRAIIRATTHHLHDFDQAVIYTSVGQLAPVSWFVGEAPEAIPTASLGALSKLPPELITAVCLELDVLSCFRFRQVNLQARALVSDMPQYWRVTFYATDCFWAMLKTGIASYYTIADLYRSLCTQTCTFCKSFGGFFFLPTASRCCLRCIEESEETQVLSLNSVSKLTQLSHKQLSSVMPVMKSIPGNYSMWKSSRKRRVKLVSATEAQKSLRKLGVELNIESTTITIYCVHPTSKFMASTTLPWLDLKTQLFHEGLSCKGCAIAYSKSFSWTRTQTMIDNWKRAYSPTGFLEHFASCHHAKELWVSSSSGNGTVKEQ